jgi:hypothetical protein
MHKADHFPLEKVEDASCRHQDFTWLSYLLERHLKRPKGKKARNAQPHVLCL